MVDGLLVTNEVMDEAEKRKNYFVVDVDFEKACDFVCWKILFLYDEEDEVLWKIYYLD